MSVFGVFLVFFMSVSCLFLGVFVLCPEHFLGFCQFFGLFGRVSLVFLVFGFCVYREFPGFSGLFLCVSFVFSYIQSGNF